MIAQNRSSAVMQQRIEPHDSLDDFPTPPWATRALCEALQNPCDDLLLPSHVGAKGSFAPSTCLLNCREPAANRGHMVRPLSEYFASVDASDIHDYGAGFAVKDYLFGPLPEAVDWTICNPPFRLAEQFIARALATSRVGVAMIVRSAFLEGGARHKSLFSKTPPARILQFAERVPMVKGRLDRKVSSATAYCWLLWLTSDAAKNEPTRFEWIAPCRAGLDRAFDWPAVMVGDAAEKDGML